MTENQQHNLTTIEILNKLSELRNSDLEEKDFWDEYLFLISLLTKSALTFIVRKNNEKLELLIESENELNENDKNYIYNNLSHIIERAYNNTYSYEKSNIENKYISAINLDKFDEDFDYYLFFLTDNSNKNDLTNLIIRVLLCKDVPLNNFSTNEVLENQLIPVEQNTDEHSHHRLTNIVELINLIVNENKFQLALVKLVDELANRFNVDRVSIGWEFNQYVTPKAISHVEDFLKSSYSAKALEAIYEEAYEQDSEIFYPEDINSDLITNAHKIYIQDNKIKNLYSFPIRLDDNVIGVISFEMKESEILPEDLETIRLALNLCAPLLNKLYFNDQNIIKKSLLKIEQSTKFMLGPKKSLLKLLTISFSILFLWIMFGKLEYKVETVTTLETDNLAYISAPFDGMVNDVFIDSGDFVEKDQKLLAFDDKEMLLKKLEINADIIRYDTEAEKARSQRKLADMQIALAKKEQSITSLKKLDYFLEKSELKSPFRGIVVEGDREKLLGSPFSKGEVLIQIANPTDLYAKLKVEEQFIDEIKIGQIAELNLLSKPHEYFNVRIEKIIPMASVDDQNGNVFTIKVKFEDDVKPWMRPGMSGVAKIKIEDRPVYWLLTHKISDFLYMNVWW